MSGLRIGPSSPKVKVKVRLAYHILKFHDFGASKIEDEFQEFSGPVGSL